MKKILVINSGSSTVKADVFAVEDGQPVFVAKALADKIGKADATLTVKGANLTPQNTAIPGASIADAIGKIIEAFTAANICSAADIAAVGHRVVHGGSKFSAPAIVDEEIIAAIRAMVVFAPLHNPANLAGIEFCRTKFAAVGEERGTRSRTVPQVAVFDTAFHQTMPAVATTYAIPRELSEKYGIRRYGFHGTSHEYVTRECARRMNIPYESFNAISLHLGNGASACAVKNGKSIDTSMGFTPLEGLVMGTRSGDIDPSLPFFLQNTVGLSAGDAEALLNKKSGLAGLSGSNDMREIVTRADAGDAAALLAVDIFYTRVRKYIGAYLTHGRPHALIFTGGIGENAAKIRQQIVAGLEHLGIAVDLAKNAALPPGGCISAASQTAVYVINTDEELMIARETQRLAGL